MTENNCVNQHKEICIKNAISINGIIDHLPCGNKDHQTQCIYYDNGLPFEHPILDQLLDMDKHNEKV